VAYTDPKDVSGKSNVLLKAPVKPWGPASKFPPETFRKPGAAPVPGPPYDLSYVLAASTYTEFEERMWEVHDTLHVWVGGTMGNPAWAAYDPLFWAHHTMVDRVWRIWQHSANAQPPPATSLETALEPRGMRVRETLEVRALGYDYAGTASTVPGTLAPPSGGS
jgi:tyrosinase